MTRHKQEKVGIAIDGWKLPIFRRHLENAHYDFKKIDGPEGAIFLTVMTRNRSELRKVVEAAQLEAAMSPLNPARRTMH